MFGEAPRGPRRRRPETDHPGGGRPPGEPDREEPRRRREHPDHADPNPGRATPRPAKRLRPRSKSREPHPNPGPAARVGPRRGTTSPTTSTASCDRSRASNDSIDQHPGHAFIQLLTRGLSAEWKWQLKKGPLRPREKGPPVGSVSTSTLLRHSETAHPAPTAGNPPSPLTPTPTPGPAVPVGRGVRSFVARRVPGTLWTVGTRASRPGRKAHNCHPSRPSRSYAPPTSRQASQPCVSGGGSEPGSTTPQASTAPGCRRPAPRRGRQGEAAVGGLAVTPEAPGQLDRLQHRQIQLADLIEQLRGRGPGEGCRQRVPPLPVLVLQPQERPHRVVPLLGPRPPGPPAGGTGSGTRRPAAASGNAPAAPRSSNAITTPHRYVTVGRRGRVERSTSGADSTIRFPRNRRPAHP